MTATYRVRHLTRYAYDTPVGSCVNVARVQPRTTPSQDVNAFTLHIDPAPDDRRAHRDVYGNEVTYFSIGGEHDVLSVMAESEVVVRAAPLPTDGRGPWEASVVPTGRQAGEGALLTDFALPSRLVPALDALEELARPSFRPGRDVVEAVSDLLERLHATVQFDPTVTTVATPISEVVELHRGVCQDFAHLAVGCLRAVGLASRYVSGYLETDATPGQPRLIGADASHAWCSVWIAGHGWLDLDPTNGHVPSDRHVTVAWGRDYSDVTPVKGIVFAGGANQQLTVEVDVSRRA